MKNQDLIAARRSIIRIFRTEIKDFGEREMTVMVEGWGFLFLQLHFPNTPEVRVKWMGSEVFWKWANHQYNLRNYELLMQYFQLHITERFSTEKFKEFLDVYNTMHDNALSERYPCKPIVDEIKRQSC